MMRARQERRVNLQNFDSGLTVEGILRDELRQLLPSRYAVAPGIVCDSSGDNAGEYDIVIHNDIWFPNLRSAPDSLSRRTLLAIESVYALIEVKQTLTVRTLDDAMEKLVIAHRLRRAPVPRDRISENGQTTACTHAIANPLFSAVVAVQLDARRELDELVERFYRINALLGRAEMVRCLCILGVGGATWGYFDPETDEMQPALFFHRDLYESIFPVMMKAGEGECALYNFVQFLLLHLYHSVLAPEDVAATYGRASRIAFPRDPALHLPPDPDYLAFLDEACNNDEWQRLRGHEHGLSQYEKEIQASENRP